MFKKKKTYVILIIIIAIVGSVFYFKNKKPKVEYTTQDVKTGTLAQTVSVTGVLASPNQADLSFKISGRLEKMYVDIGDPVVKGQKIATIDGGTLNSQLNQAKAELRSQKQTLASMKRGGYNVEKERAQREQVRAAEAAVSQILDQIRETTIYAPIDGFIIKKSSEVGEIIAANSAAGNTPVVTIARNDDLEIRTNVPESDIVKVTLGQNADVTLDALSSADVFNAKVSEIEPASTVIQDVVYYKVKLKFDSLDPRFKNGMSTDADIKTAERSNVVFAPMRAVKTENGQKYVEVLKDEKNGVTEKVNVTTGMGGDDGMVEIKSGLKGGEKVVTLTKNI
ncbi:MAG: efflux RND transporter periplasmic adaptor subunit [Parcubacteria group bacterium]|jgi:multidrug efflux pump subunit AcrA (membrane-fusion protein)